VIITGLNLTEEQPWTLEFVKERCFNKRVQLKMLDEGMESWGRLRKDAGNLKMHEFIDTFTSNKTRRQWYLHDWSLPTFCPEVFGPMPYRDFTMPKYFTNDYFQRTFTGFRHTWPSLFIGSDQTESKMHIDSGNTNFWLYLLSGKKEWRFYSQKDYINLYQHPSGEQFMFDTFKPDITQFPLTEYAEVHTCIQEPGELVFIPAGNPHAVRNLEPIHGVSMNYVDASNVGLFLDAELFAATVSDNAGTRLRHWLVVQDFTNGAKVPQGMQYEAQPLRFGEWKSTPWRNLTYDVSSFD